MSGLYSDEELAAECAKIRLAYMWLSEDTIKRYAEQALKNKYENEYKKSTDTGATAE
jgi:hypothetical protein